MNMKKMACAIVPTLLFATQAVAAPKVINREPVPFPVQIEPATPDEGITPEQFQAEMKAIGERAKRSIAETDEVTDAALSVELLNLRSEIIGGPKYDMNKQATQVVLPGIKRSDEEGKDIAELWALYKRLDDDAIYSNPSLPQDYKFVAAQLAFLKIFRGFYNRCKDLFADANLSHGATVTALRSLASGVATYLPDPQWEVGLKYVSYPAPELNPIDRISAFHLFLDAELVPALKKLSNRIKMMNFAERPIYFDNQILYGKSFKTATGNDRDRYIRMGEVERKAALANAYAATSGALSLTSYWLGGLFDAMDDIGKIYGIGEVFRPEGASAAKRFPILQKYADRSCKKSVKRAFQTITRDFTNIRDRLAQIIQKRDESCEFLTLRQNGKISMADSYKYLGWAVAVAKLSWEELGRRSTSTSKGPDGQPDTRNIFDPRLYAPFNRVATANLNGLDYIVKQNGGKLTSAVVSTDDMEVDLKKFFLGEGTAEKSPPMSLSVFFPYDFSVHEAKDAYRQTAMIGGKPYEWHNFRNGMPTHWNHEMFSRYLKTVSSNDDVRKMARISSQAWGGWLVGLPLATLMF